jgi:hypothetical protein
MLYDLAHYFNFFNDSVAVLSFHADQRPENLIKCHALHAQHKYNANQYRLRK